MCIRDSIYIYKSKKYYCLRKEHRKNFHRTAPQHFHKTPTSKHKNVALYSVVDKTLDYQFTYHIINL